MLGPARTCLVVVCDKALTARPAESRSDLTTSGCCITLCDMKHVISGEHWPGAEVFCFDIKYRNAPEFGDIKYVWDLNRLQFLQPLAAAVALSGDAAALAAIERAIESWAEANRPFGGVAWSSGSNCRRGRSV